MAEETDMNKMFALLMEQAKKNVLASNPELANNPSLLNAKVYSELDNMLGSKKMEDANSLFKEVANIISEADRIEIGRKGIEKQINNLRKEEYQKSKELESVLNNLRTEIMVLKNDYDIEKEDMEKSSILANTSFSQWYDVVMNDRIYRRFLDSIKDNEEYIKSVESGETKSEAIKRAIRVTENKVRETDYLAHIKCNDEKAKQSKHAVINPLTGDICPTGSKIAYDMGVLTPGGSGNRDVANAIGAYPIPYTEENLKKWRDCMDYDPCKTVYMNRIEIAREERRPLSVEEELDIFDVWESKKQ